MKPKIDLNSVKKFEIEELEERLEMTIAEPEADGEWSTEDRDGDGQDDTLSYGWN